MKLPGLLRSRPALPGLTATARVGRDPQAVLGRVKPGEIAVVDRVDLDRATAEAFVAARVAAVVNAASSISGRYPTLGAEVLLDAGIPLLDGVGPEIMTLARDGTPLRLLDGVVYAGEIRLGSGTVQTRESVAGSMEEAKAGLTHQVEAFAANAIEFMRRERALLLEGVGVPDIGAQLGGRHVLVVVPGPDHLDELARLRGYIREYRPAMVGVGAGADALVALGYRPDVVVGDPAQMANAVLTSGADVVLPAFADGHAPGLHRAQDLGASAVCFPSSANAEDLALLLAAHHGAALIVTVGMGTGMVEFLDRGRSSVNASTFLTRLQLDGLVVDAAAIRTLHRSRVPVAAVVLLVVAVVFAGAAVLSVSAVGEAVGMWLAHAVRVLVEQVRSWFA